jgi:hypothetical protein
MVKFTQQMFFAQFQIVLVKISGADERKKN